MSGFPSTGGVPLSQSRVYRVRVDLAHPIYNPDTGQKLDGKKVFWTGKTRPPRSGHPGSGWAEFVLADDQETRFFLRPNLVVPDESFGPSAQYRRNPQHSDAVPFASVKVGQRFKAAEDEESGSRLGGSVNWWEKVNEQQAVLVRTGAVYDFRGDEACLVEYIGSGMMGVPKSPAYNREAVDAAIESSNRAGRRIGGREARAIHGLLKGWRKNPDDPRSRFIVQLTREYERLFETPEYEFSAKRTTPELLAIKMTDGLLAGTANKDGEGIKRTCKALGIPYTYAGIKAYLSGGVRRNPAGGGDSLGVGSYGTLLIGKGSRVKPVRVKIVGYRDKVRGETHNDPSARYAVFVEQEGSFRLGITDAKSIKPA